MGKVALLPREATSEDAGRHDLVERSMPVNYMADFSVLGILVDRLPEAIRLLEKHRFDIVMQNCFAEVDINGPDRAREMFHILDSDGIGYRFSDIADRIYQG